MENIEDKCDVLLDINSPTFAEDFRAAIGAKPGEAIEIATPQFKRTDGLRVPVPQITNFADLPKLSDQTLKQIGFQKWDEPDSQGRTLWLYPAEWYDLIPEGTPLVDINGDHSLMKRGETDDDMRFGALAYGFYKHG